MTTCIQGNQKQNKKSPRNNTPPRYLFTELKVGFFDFSLNILIELLLQSFFERQFFTFITSSACLTLLLLPFTHIIFPLFLLLFCCENYFYYSFYLDFFRLDSNKQKASLPHCGILTYFTLLFLLFFCASA